MKKIFFLMLMIASCFSVANAQLLVDENGKVGVGVETNATLASLLNVNSMGSSNCTVHIIPDNTTQSVGLYVRRLGTTSSGYQVAGQFNSSYIAPELCSIGVMARATSSNPVNGGRSFGVMAYAGNATSGYNYGVFGVLSGTADGAGVYGSTTAEENGIDVGGRYAGFFRGNVYTSGILTAREITTLSDYRLKRNIQSIQSNDDSPLENLMNLNVVKYNYADIENAMQASSRELQDTAHATMTVQTDELSLAESAETHYGLIAQELQAIYPELVKEGRGGYLTINYIEIIPLLINSIQELKSEVDFLRENSAAILHAPTTRNADTDITNVEVTECALYQNTPNPFTENTLIRVDVTENAVKADLYVYNMNGEQVAEFAIDGRGETNVVIDGGCLSAGMYLYALVVDSKVIDTKRMILTK